MKNTIKLILLSLLLTKMINAQNVNKKSTVVIEKVRAKENESVWIIINKVKYEKKAEYDQFMKDVFLKTLRSSSNKTTQVSAKQTRYLVPDKMNSDSTWSYVFIFDPVNPSGDYSIPALLKEKYTDAEVENHMRSYDSFMAKPTQIVKVKQSMY